MPTSFKLVGFGLLLTFIGFFIIQKDVRLRIWGKPAKADVMNAWARVKNQKVVNIELAYQFEDPKGETVKGGAFVAPEWALPEGGKVDVVYLPNKPETNRLASDRSSGAYWVFAGGIVLLIVGGVYFNRESVLDAHRDTAEALDGPKSRAERIIRNVVE
ncbi:MAG TPA: hypothetical protein VGP72_33340 [Planctomycetota bacterium]|jgi:hypothetical protein